MATRLTLICDGATAATRVAAFPRDEPLEDRALSRAAVLGHGLRRADRALTSLALRARQTAAALSLDAAVYSSLRDCDYGRWAGRRLADVHEKEPDGIAAWISDADAGLHGGESLADLFRRVSDWMNECIREDGHTIAVTHMGFIGAAILHVLDAPARSFWRIDIER
jgi:broad specificity phosphatase PhoE